MKVKTIDERVAEEVRKNTLLLEKAYKEELLHQQERIWDTAVAQIRAWMPRLMRGLVAVQLWMNHSTFGHGKERCERLMADVVPNLSAILRAVDWRENIEDASDKAFAVAVERLRTVVGIDINDPKYDEIFKDIIIIGERKIG